MSIKNYDAPILRALDEFDSTIAPKLGEALVTRYTATRIERGWQGQETESQPFIAVVMRRGYDLPIEDRIGNFELKRIYVAQDSKPMSPLPKTEHIRVINKDTKVEIEYTTIEELLLGKPFRLVEEYSGLEIQYDSATVIPESDTNDFLDASDAAAHVAERYRQANPDLLVTPAVEGSWDSPTSPKFHPSLTFSKEPKNLVDHGWLDSELPLKVQIIDTTTN
jgi:hypothetical protein